jgi:hypothetical protein
MPNSKVIQHNCQKSGEVLMAVMEIGVKRKADIILIQEPPVSVMYRHAGYEYLRTGGRVMMARMIDSEWTCSMEDRLAEEVEGDVQVLPIRRRGYVGHEVHIADVHDQKRNPDDRERPSRLANSSANSPPVGELNEVRLFYAPSARSASSAKQSRICRASIKKSRLHRGTRGSTTSSRLCRGSRGYIGPQ